MPKYSNPLDPRHAARQYRGQPGNYVLHFENGDAYAGRQGGGGRRLETHLRRHDDITAVRFMTDHADSSCQRATRERKTVEQLRGLGVPVRNRIRPSMPTTCVAPVPVRRAMPSRTRRDESGAVAVVVGLGLLALAGWAVNELCKPTSSSAV